jgi:hypothetical protein
MDEQASRRAAMKSPRGDYYQGDIADPHRTLHIVERHLDAAPAQAVAEKDEEIERWKQSMEIALSAEDERTRTPTQ